MANEMVTIVDIDTFNLGGYILKTPYPIRQYYECQNVFVVRAEQNNNGHLYAYGYLKNDLKLMWEFPYDDVVGIALERPELKKPNDFITPKHYQTYMETYTGKELLIVYAGNFRYRIDANTGEIYDKMESR